MRRRIESCITPSGRTCSRSRGMLVLAVTQARTREMRCCSSAPSSDFVAEEAYRDRTPGDIDGMASTLTAPSHADHDWPRTSAIS